MRDSVIQGIASPEYKGYLDAASAFLPTSFVREGFDQGEEERMRRNIAAFARAFNHIEYAALCRSLDEWDADKVRSYKEADQFIWASLLLSIPKASSLSVPNIDIRQLSLDPDIAIPRISVAFQQNLHRSGRWGRKALALAYQAMVPQIAGEVIGNSISLKEDFPSFGGLGFPVHNRDEVIRQEVRRYTREAQKYDWSVTMPLLLRLYPMIVLRQYDIPQWYTSASEK